VQVDAWRWAQQNRAEDSSLPSGKDIGRTYGRHERWGRMVKRSGLAGEFDLHASATGRVIAAWPSFALIASYELLMRQVRRAAEASPRERQSHQSRRSLAITSASDAAGPPVGDRSRTAAAIREGRTASQGVRMDAWRWAQANRAQDGSLPSASRSRGNMAGMSAGAGW
jgi:hypothetical protein